jgi:hypothetical protein
MPVLKRHLRRKASRRSRARPRRAFVWRSRGNVACGVARASDARWGAAQPDHGAQPEFRYSAGINGNIFTTALELLDKYNGAVTAVATAFIAIFTIVLVFVTGRPARLTTAALNLARQEFVATHRPRVILRYIQSPFENEEGFQFYWVTFVNIGGDRAIIEALGADLARRSDETDRWAVAALCFPITIPNWNINGGTKFHWDGPWTRSTNLVYGQSSPNDPARIAVIASHCRCGFERARSRRRTERQCCTNLIVEIGHFPSWPLIEILRPCNSSSETVSTVRAFPRP